MLIVLIVDWDSNFSFLCRSFLRFSLTLVARVQAKCDVLEPNNKSSPIRGASSTLRVTRSTRNYMEMSPCLSIKLGFLYGFRRIALESLLSYETDKSVSQLYIDFYLVLFWSRRSPCRWVHP